MMQLLLQSSLFNAVDEQRIEKLMESHGASERSYAKGDIIALQDSRYVNLILLAEGRVMAEKGDSKRGNVTVEYISSPALIAPAYLFSEENTLPVTLTAASPVTVITIERADLLDMMGREQQVLVNFLRVISTPNKFISEKMIYLTYKTIKSKFANYLLNLIEEQSSTELRNKLTQREMAELFGVTRPALARAMGELVEEGTIYVKGKEIEVIFEEKLRHYART